MKLEKIKLFNEDGDDRQESQKILGGNPTGITNMNQTAFPWTNSMYMNMMKNHWIPQKVSLVDDKATIKLLTEKEIEVTELTLSYLVFLDSYQILNLPNIAEYITCTAVKDLIVIQQFQEVVHSRSYQYILDSLFPLLTKERIYNLWRDNPLLKKRVKKVAEVGQAFLDEPSLENFKKVLAMNFILEGIFFYQGFNFFDQLRSRSKLVQTGQEIDYIRRDEATHMALFIHLIKHTFEKEDYNMLTSLMKENVEEEIEFSHKIYGNHILGISEDSSAQYLEYLGNHRIQSFGLPHIYPEQGLTNPYKHLEGDKRNNFFESTVTEYDNSASIDGWEDF